MKKQYITLGLLGIVLLLGFMLYQQNLRIQSAQEMDGELKIEMSTYDPSVTTSETHKDQRSSSSRRSR